jgi:hypothetical protein
LDIDGLVETVFGDDLSDGVGIFGDVFDIQRRAFDGVEELQDSENQDGDAKEDYGEKQ